MNMCICCAQASISPRQTFQWRQRARRLRWCSLSLLARPYARPTCTPDRCCSPCLTHAAFYYYYIIKASLPVLGCALQPRKQWLAYRFCKMEITVRCRALGMGNNSTVPITYESHQIAGAGQQKSEGGSLHAVQVDILIVNCSLFNPTPSLSAMVVNHFGMRPDIKSYNLSGMGCSAGIISIGLARELLQVHMLTLMIFTSAL